LLVKMKNPDMSLLPRIIVEAGFDRTVLMVKAVQPAVSPMIGKEKN